jgi:hypothetical protein
MSLTHQRYAIRVCFLAPTGVPEQSSPEREVSGSPFAQKAEDASEENTEVVLQQLLSYIYNHEDKQAAVAAAMQAVCYLQRDKVTGTKLPLPLSEIDLRHTPHECALLRGCSERLDC